MSPSTSSAAEDPRFQPAAMPSATVHWRAEDAPQPQLAALPRQDWRGGLPAGALRRVLLHIEENLGERVGLGTLAAVAGLSKWHFGRAFKRSVGTAPHSYLVQRRIERAKQLVAETNRPLADIGYETGFADQSHFTHVFAAMVGATPLSFRRRCRCAL